MADVDCQDGGGERGQSPSRPMLAPQNSLHDMSDIPTANGLAKREVTKFSDTWNNVCKNSMVGTGEVLQCAAIANHNGNVYSSTPDDFIPTIEQIKTIVSAMNNPGIVATRGIKVAGESFAYSECQISGSSAHSFSGKRADGNGGVFIYITKHTILIGTYKGEQNSKREAADQLMKDIWDFVKAAGF